MMTRKYYFLFFCFSFLVFGCARQNSAEQVMAAQPVFTTPMRAPIAPVANKFNTNVQVPLKADFETKTVVIDPGHGGEDYGTKSLTKPKYHEKSLNLTTALLLNSYLRSMGFKTLMTRSKDEFISLQKRADMANEIKADLFVSVHYNSAPSKEAEGVEIFYYRSEEDKIRARESKKLASKVLSKVIRATDAKSRGVKHGDFAVIRKTKMPAILIEGGFLTNASELEKVKDPQYVKTLAFAIAQGVQGYFAEN